MLEPDLLVPGRADVNPFSDEFTRCPFPHLASMRAECPVRHIGDLPFYFVTSYELCIEVLRQPELFGSGLEGFLPAFEQLGMTPSEADLLAMTDSGLDVPAVMHRHLVHSDPPVHTRQRKLVNRWFTGRAVEQRWLGLIEHEVADLADGLRGKTQSEFVAEFATPLPIRIIAAILGVTKEEAVPFKAWSDAFVTTGGGRSSSDVWMAKSLATTEMHAFFTAALEERRTNPKGDLLSELVAATEETQETGVEPLLMSEALDICDQLLVAGNETTTQLLGELMRLFCLNPGEFEKLSGSPDSVTQAVEEGLRMSTPIVSMLRWAGRDTTLAGVEIPAGSIVAVSFGGANRDAGAFEEPDVFNLMRKNLTAHMAFGRGIHTCLGAALARAEAKASYAELSTFMTKPRFDPSREMVRDGATIALRGLTSLPIVYDLVDFAETTQTGSSNDN
jgi:cytochrome P450